jgi:hypothetical protein
MTNIAMRNETNHLIEGRSPNSPGIGVAGWSGTSIASADAPPSKTLSLFDDRSLDGWSQIENTAMAVLVKSLNRVVSGPSIYDKTRFSKVTLRPETDDLLKENPQGQQLARLNKLLLEDAYPAELTKSALTGWIVKDGAMASTGSGRGVIRGG